LLDLPVLTKPTGARGGYTFDDPMFREWMSRVQWYPPSTGARITALR
jgi:hypothetical protein